MFRRSKPQFSRADAEAIMKRALPQVEQRLGAKVFCTLGEPVVFVTESHVLNELEQRVLDSPLFVDVGTLAAGVRLPMHTVEPLLRRVVAKHQLFFDGVRVLTPKCIENAVKSFDRIVSISEFCEQTNFTIKAAEHVFDKPGSQVVIVDHLLVPEQLLQSHEEQLKSALESASKPVQLASIETDARILPVLKKRLNIPSHETVYVPAKFVEDQCAQAEKLLAENQYVDLNDFEPSIKNQVAKKVLANVKGSVELGQYVVSNQLLESSLNEINKHLAENLWFDTRDLPLQPKVANYLLEKHQDKFRKLQSKNKPAILVKPALERRAIDRVVSVWEKAIDEQATKLDFTKVDGSSTLDSFVNKITLPATQDLQETVEELNAPTEIGLASQITPAVRKQLAQYATKAVEPLFKAALQRAEAKVRAYLNGCVSVMNDDRLSAFFPQVWEEFQQYVADKQFPVPENQQVAKSQFAVPEDLVDLAVKDLQQNAAAKIRKLDLSPKNAARSAPLLLHLAVVLFYSLNIAKDSFLTIRGKLISKLVKAGSGFPPSFAELRANIKDPKPELLETVKADALRGI